MSKSLLECTSFNLGYNAQYDKIKPELVSDVKMYFLFEKSMNGGVSSISK